MSDLVRASPLPGWYDDPAGSGQLRWWTGAGWTEHLAPKAQPAPRVREVEPLAIAAPAQVGNGGYEPFAMSRYTGTSAQLDPRSLIVKRSGHTVPIWLLAFYPLIAAGVEVYLRLIATPDLASVLVLAFTLVFMVFTAAWDHGTLRSRGLPAPSVFWLLLTVFAYFIARRIVLGRVGVKANAPGNVLAAYFLTLIALSVAVVVISGIRP